MLIFDTYSLHYLTEKETAMSYLFIDVLTLTVLIFQVVKGKSE